MSEKEDAKPNGSTTSRRGEEREDPLALAHVPSEIPAGLDRRKFIMRSAVISAAAVMNGCTRAETEQDRPSASRRRTGVRLAPAVPLSADLDVVKKGAGPVLTTVDEFYKVGPGPSSSHTIGPMRITYDFYQRARNCPPTSWPRRRSSR